MTPIEKLIQILSLLVSPIYVSIQVYALTSKLNLAYVSAAVLIILCVVYLCLPVSNKRRKEAVSAI